MKILEIRGKTLPIASPIRDACVAMPDLHDIGFEGKSDLCKVMRELSA